MKTDKLIQKITKDRKLERLIKNLNSSRDHAKERLKEIPTVKMGLNPVSHFDYKSDEDYLKARKEYYEYTIPMLEQIEEEKTYNTLKLNEINKKYLDEIKGLEGNLKALEEKVRELLVNSDDGTMYDHYKLMSIQYKKEDKPSDEIAKGSLDSIIGRV